jgi:hypothetical protein
MGILYAGYNLSVDSTITGAEEFKAAAKDLVSGLLDVLEPSMKEAKRLLQELNASFLDKKGASGSKYLAVTALEPTLFAASEREAIRRAVTRREEFLPDGRERKRGRLPSWVGCHLLR